MTKQAKITTTPTVATPGAGRLVLTQTKDETNAAALARHVTGPLMNAALSINALHKGAIAGEPLDSTALMQELESQVAAVNSGKLARGEAMLTTQAHTLDALFNNLLAKAMSHKDLTPYETLLRLAFKAQSQCRATWESVSEIKNPRSVAFVKQANIANNQQINHGPGAREIESQPTKLLETTRNEWMDPRATSQAGRGNQALETVGAINGTTQ